MTREVTIETLDIMEGHGTERTRSRRPIVIILSQFSVCVHRCDRATAAGGHLR